MFFLLKVLTFILFAVTLGKAPTCSPAVSLADVTDWRKAQEELLQCVLLFLIFFIIIFNIIILYLLFFFFYLLLSLKFIVKYYL